MAFGSLSGTDRAGKPIQVNLKNMMSFVNRPPSVNPSGHTQLTGLNYLRSHGKLLPQTRARFQAQGSLGEGKVPIASGCLEQDHCE
jgi:hypothetical protein